MGVSARVWPQGLLGLKPPARARLILLAGCLGLFGVSFSMNVPAVALPSLGSTFVCATAFHTTRASRRTRSDSEGQRPAS